MPEHIIVLIQQSDSHTSRTYYDFDDHRQMMEGLLKIYEDTLKTVYKHMTTITYDVTDVYAFMDGLGDIACLTLDSSTGKYTPHDREYIKSKLFKHIQGLATRS